VKAYFSNVFSHYELFVITLIVPVFVFQISHIHDLLEKLAEDLKSGNVSLASLAITKQLTKEPDDYPDKKSLPHVQVC
jgi:DNA polymerase elongation subunit (family B)